MKPVLIKEKEYLSLFRVSIYIKGINAIIEMFSGILIWFTSKVVLVTFILNFFQNELSDDPKDYVANFIVNSAAALSVSSQYFIGAYLFFHGVVKIFLLTGLFRKKLWAYPASVVIFSLLIIYQFYKYYFSHSIWILVFTLIDVLIVLLAIHEYGVIKRKKQTT